MTYGTAKLFKTGTRKDGIPILGMIVPMDIIRNEDLKAGCRVQFNLDKLKNIPVEGPKHGQHFKKEVKNETEIPV